MKRIKGTIAIVFLAGAALLFVSESRAFPPFLPKAKKFGAKDCRFCHVNIEGGEPYNARGEWLIKEKERRKADMVDPEWLVDYKETKSKKK
ncbi:MAG TPA: hypothetical protein VNO14_04920 [Blastocatellia bacterium]|nr:hypothetical protein [Blastocatellia bacterium]